MGQLKYSVFLCFRGEDVRVGFLSYLIGTLKRKSIKYYVDYEETRGEVMEIFLQRIAESRIVLVILSPKFMESDWCIDEVLKALETREAGTSIIPVFYKVSVADVKGWNIVKQGDRDKFINVTKRLGLRSKDYPTSEADFVNKIVEELEKALTKLETEEEENKLKMKQAITTNTTMPFFGTNKRVKQLQEKLMMGIPTHTRLVGVVGMKGSGKTNLAEMFFEEGKCYFLRHLFFRDKIGKNMESGAKRDLLVQQFQKNLLKISNTEEKINSKLLLVLDDFSDKEDIICLFGDRGWITPGSKIVIVASDKSLVEGLVDDTYVVPEHGPVIETELRRHESENRLIGLDLCAVVSFQHCQDQISGFHVKCTYEFKNADGSLIRRLRCTVGGFSGTWTEPRKVESDHVFVSYTSLLEDQETEEDKKVCSSTKVSVKFEVIDDAGELVTRSVLKCGFSMVYEPEGTDHDKVSWEVGCDGPPNVADQNTDDDDEPMSFTTQEAEVSGTEWSNPVASACFSSIFDISFAVINFRLYSASEVGSQSTALSPQQRLPTTRVYSI
ncbi:hypothetical protein F2Q70_00009207 [Brassica cretica]|uniref:TIR domain-containing protein n=1 Tax=Brassica cretica TaxID=69181 RepID=A0A8S9LYJ5_BRACR|nr:hypothetical protein F2Q70_00009207 [Brassica cretica]